MTKEQEEKLIEAGWRMRVTGTETTWIEPRTGISFTPDGALWLLERHANDETVVMAAKVGEFVHGEMYTSFGKPTARSSELMCIGGSSYMTRDVGVWFVGRKASAQFMSKAGHRQTRKR